MQNATKKYTLVIFIVVRMWLNAMKRDVGYFGNNFGNVMNPLSLGRYKSKLKDGHLGVLRGTL